MLGNVMQGNNNTVVIHWISLSFDNYGTFHAFTEHDKHKRNFEKSLKIIKIIDKLVILQRNFKMRYYAFGGKGFEKSKINFYKRLKNM